MGQGLDFGAKQTWCLSQSHCGSPLSSFVKRKLWRPPPRRMQHRSASKSSWDMESKISLFGVEGIETRAWESLHKAHGKNASHEETMYGFNHVHIKINLPFNSILPRIFPSGLVAYVASLAQGQEILNKMLAISSNRTDASLVHSTQLNSVPLPQRDLSGPDDSWQCCLPSTSLQPPPGILLRLLVRGQLSLRAQRLPSVTSACPRPACGLVLIGLAAAHSLSSSCCYYEQLRHGSPRSLLGKAVPGCWLRSLLALPIVIDWPGLLPPAARPRSHMMLCWRSRLDRAAAVSGVGPV